MMAEIKQAYRYRLDPNDEQASYLGRCCGMARFVYNWGLADRKELFDTHEGAERFVSFFDQCKRWIAFRDEHAAWAKDLPAGVALCALQNLDRAFANFRRRCKEKAGPPGFPKFKARYKSRSAFQIAGGAIKPVDGAVYMPKLGTIRTFEDLRIEGTVKTGTVFERAGQWFVVFLAERDRAMPPEPLDDVAIIGVHFGIRHFCVLSTGETVDHPRPLRAAEAKLKRAQRILSRRVKGSKGREEARLAVAKIHAHVVDLREDFTHKVTTGLAQRGCLLAVSDFGVRDMMHTAAEKTATGISKGFADVAVGMACRQLAYKSPWYGSLLVTAPRDYPVTQRCSRCGVIREPKLRLDELIFTCHACRHTEDREANAARNLVQWVEQTYRQRGGN